MAGDMKDDTGEVAKLMPGGPLRWLAWLLPHERTTPAAMFRWRVIVVALLLPTASLTALAYGGVPWVSEHLFSGFATKNDVQQISSRVDRMDQRLLESSILDLRIRQCAATTPEAKQLYAARIQPLLIEYLQLTGKTYPLPACSDL